MGVGSKVIVQYLCKCLKSIDIGNEILQHLFSYNTYFFYIYMYNNKETNWIGMTLSIQAIKPTPSVSQYIYASIMCWLLDIHNTMYILDMLLNVSDWITEILNLTNLMCCNTLRPSIVQKDVHVLIIHGSQTVWILFVNKSGVYLSSPGVLCMHRIDTSQQQLVT